MVTLKALSDSEPFIIRCPDCNAEILSVGEHHSKVLNNTGFVADGDALIPLDDVLTETQKKGLVGWACALQAGSCDSCRKAYLVFEVTMIMDDVPRVDFVEKPFDGFGMHDGRHFLVSQGDRNWVMQWDKRPPSNKSYRSMFEHWLGPIAWADTSWVGPFGVKRDGREEAAAAFEYGTKIVLALWDDLHELALRETGL